MLKKLFCLLLLAGVAPLAHAQLRPFNESAAPANALATSSAREHDTIVLELTDAPAVIWRRLAQVLVARGHAIEHSSAELLTLTTYPLRARGSSVRIAGMVEGQTLTLRPYALYKLPDSPESIERVRRGGGSNAEWQELEAIGRQLGGIIRYTTSAAPQ